MITSKIRGMIGLALLTLAIVVSSFFWYKGPFWQRATAHKDLSMNVKDLRENGIRIVQGNDPTFADLLSSSTNGRARELAVPLHNVSYFLQNDTDRYIVGYTIKWDLTRPDGKTRTHMTNYLASEALMGRPVTAVHGVIAPHSAGFLSFDLPPGSKPDRLVEGLDSSSQTIIEKHIARVQGQIARFNGLTVSLDSVLLDDGRFLGPDTAQSFDKINASIRAERDLLAEFEHNVHLGQPDFAFNKLQEVARGPKITINSNTSPNEFYEYHQKAWAQRFLQARQTLGDAAAVTRIIARSHQRPLELKKQ